MLHTYRCSITIIFLIITFLNKLYNICCLDNEDIGHAIFYFFPRFIQYSGSLILNEKLKDYINYLQLSDWAIIFYQITQISFFYWTTQIIFVEPQSEPHPTFCAIRERGGGEEQMVDDCLIKFTPKRRGFWALHITALLGHARTWLPPAPASYGTTKTHSTSRKLRCVWN